MKTSYKHINPYITKDGSEIRELINPNQGQAVNQSLAEAIVPPGRTTLLHCHEKTEEIYHITAGEGIMTLGDEEFPVTVSDSILIRPGTPHKIENSGLTKLKILCCCSPAYSHEDTFIMKPENTEPQT